MWPKVGMPWSTNAAIVRADVLGPTRTEAKAVRTLQGTFSCLTQTTIPGSSPPAQIPYQLFVCSDTTRWESDLETTKLSKALELGTFKSL